MKLKKLRYRSKLNCMPSYDVVEREWKIKVNANECGMNLPPMVEDRVMGRLSRIAFNRYPNEDLEQLMEAIASNYGLQKENVLIGNGSSEIIEKLFCFWWQESDYCLSAALLFHVSHLCPGCRGKEHGY